MNQEIEEYLSQERSAMVAKIVTNQIKQTEADQLKPAVEERLLHARSKLFIQSNPPPPSA